MYDLLVIGSVELNATQRHVACSKGIDGSANLRDFPKPLSGRAHHSILCRLLDTGVVMLRIMVRGAITDLEVESFCLFLHGCFES